MQRRKYFEEFKREAILFAEQPGVTLRQIGEELGINATMIGRWWRELSANGNSAFPGRGHTRDEELASVKHELTRVKKERDFLREAAVTGVGASHGPWQSVCGQGLPYAVAGTGHRLQHEPERQPLGQCGGRELLRDLEGRAGP